MKLVFFDDYKLGVVKGDRVVDVSSVVRDIPHTGPGDLMNGLIARFDQYKGRLDDAAASGQGAALVGGAAARALAEAGQYRLHGGQLHGRRHPQRAGADQCVPENGERDLRTGRHDGIAR